MTGFGPLFAIDGPRPSAPRYTLVNAATIIPVTDEHIWNGVAVYPFPSDLPDGWDPCPPESRGSEANAAPKSSGSGTTEADFGALTVYLPITCSAFGIGDDAEFRNRAIIAMTAREAYEVEYEFWTGTTLPATPHLTDANGTVLNSGVATNLLNGLALLEEAIAATGIQGVIHATPGTVSAWSSTFQVFREGNQLITALGTRVVPGYGYDGSQPENTSFSAPSGTEAWAYATGPIEMRRSDVFTVPGTLREALDRSTNTVTFRAERYYVTDWDTTLQAGVLIDRCQDACTPPIQ